MQYRNIECSKWIVGPLVLLLLWQLTSYVDALSINRDWKRAIEYSFNRKPPAFKDTYHKFITEYQKKPIPKLKPQGAYHYSNSNVDMVITFKGDDLIEVETTTPLRGKLSATAKYKMVGSTLLFNDVTPGSGTWVFLGSSRDAVNAFPYKEQAFKTINENEMHWVGINGFWQFTRK